MTKRGEETPSADPDIFNSCCLAWPYNARLTAMQDDIKQPWTAGPPGRGTLNILWTCISTLALCVWTAVHPNIKPSVGLNSSYFARAGMMLLAIVFPEHILSTAWSQYRSARMTCSIVNNFITSQMPQQVRQRLLFLAHVSVRRLIDVLQAGSPSDKCESPAKPAQVVDISLSRERVAGIATGPSPRPRALQKRSGTSDALPQEASARGATVSMNGQRSSHDRGDFQIDDLADIETTVLMEDDGHDTAWSMEQGFFAVMGGYAVEAVTIDPTSFVPKRTQRIITFDGVAELARAGLLPFLSKRDIKDRSKADIFAKMIVLSQIVWFGLQVISRLAEGLVITPLEAHTAVHVCCTIVVYVIWLKKPYNVDVPVMLKGKEVEDVVALFAFSEINGLVYQDRFKKYEVEREIYWRDRHVRNANNILDHDPPPNRPVRTRSEPLIRFYSSEDNVPYTTTHAADTVLKALAAAAKGGLSTLSGDTGKFNDFSKSQQRVFLRDSSENFVTNAVWGSWITNAGHEWSTDKAFHILFNLLYGGGHLAAWASSSFPTDAERWLWRSSSIMLAALPIWGSLWLLWWRAVGSKNKLLFPFRNGDFDIVAGPFFFLLVCVYVLARCYFLAESLASLRSLPSSAYRTAQWPNTFPHVT